MQKVYCFFEECGVNPDAGWLLVKWSENWRSHGFDPAILTEADARNHPRYHELSAVFKSLPSVNPLMYDYYCYIRHLAMATLGGLLVDYDTMNLRFEPFTPGELTFYDRNRVPCAVSGTPDQFERIVKWIEEYKVSSKDACAGRVHISDMYIITEHSEARTLDTCRQFPDLSGELVHIANDSCGGNKRKAIGSFMP